MKNKFLLLGATAILSTGALLANAGTVSQNISNAATVNMNVEFISAVTLTEDVPFNFGKIINPEVGQKVQFPAVVGCQDITATNNEYGGAGNPAFAKIVPGSANRARLTVSGLNGYPTTAKENFSLVFGENEVTLVNSSDQECGTVTQFNDTFTFSDDSAFNDFVTNNKLCLKADFEITNVPTGNTTCTGQNTVTLVYSIDK